MESISKELVLAPAKLYRHFGNKMHRSFYTFTALIGAIIFAPGSIVAGNIQNGDTRLRPNVLLIVADDLGYETLGVNGSESYATPFLDELARSGIRFTHAFAQPSCTPSRVKLLTGRYNHRNYVGPGKLAKGEFTLGNLFQTGGYDTVVAGKWKLGQWTSNPEKSMLSVGFNNYRLWQYTVKYRGRKERGRYHDPLLEEDGVQPYNRMDKYGPDLFTDYVIDKIEEINKKGNRFFVYYPMVLTHRPFWPTPQDEEYQIKSKRTPGDERTGIARTYFRSNVSYMDSLIGRIVEAIDKLGIREETLIVFTSDNGTDKLIKSSWRGSIWQGGKSQMTDAGTRVPLILSQPGLIAEGQVSDELIDFADVLPTLAEASMLTLPDRQRFDGESFWGHATKTPVERDGVAFVFYPSRKNGGAFVRGSRYKYYADGRFYDLETDPRERNPLARDKLTKRQVHTMRRLILEIKNKWAGKNRFRGSVEFGEP